MCFLGQQLVFEEASEMLRVMRGTEINSKQIERICHHYGGMLEEEIQRGIKQGKPKDDNLLQDDQIHYVMTDGAMFLTREESWKEVKMARIFKKDDNVQSSSNRKIITKSSYVAHLGSNKEFFPKLEYHIDHLRSMVFIGDGAKWIWNWADSFYPDAVQILDYYHAAEHLHEFARDYFKDTDQGKLWAHQQKEMLSDDKVELVIKNIQGMDIAKNTKTEKERNGLIGYFQNNKHRMKYKTFMAKGFLIGSGAIESAHRHVLQQRLKLSGQRWTKVGLQQMANLRVVYKSDEWHKIKDIAKKAA